MSKWRNRRLAIRDLAQLAEAQEGKRFLLQGGDCAESFSDCESGLISNRLKVLLQMSLVLHRQGLVSPYDYTYPRLNQMSQLAKDLHAKHIVPIEQELDRLEATTRSTLAELDGAPAPAASDTEEVEPA